MSTGAFIIDGPNGATFLMAGVEVEVIDIVPDIDTRPRKRRRWGDFMKKKKTFVEDYDVREEEILLFIRVISKVCL